MLLRSTVIDMSRLYSKYTHVVHTKCGQLWKQMPTLRLHVLLQCCILTMWTCLRQVRKRSRQLSSKLAAGILAATSHRQRQTYNDSVGLAFVSTATKTILKRRCVDVQTFSAHVRSVASNLQLNCEG